MKAVRLHEFNQMPVVEDVPELAGRQPHVQRHQHGPRERHAVMRLEHHVRVRGQHRDAPAFLDPEPLERAREPGRAPAKVGVGQLELPVNRGQSLTMDERRSGQEGGRRQGCKRELLAHGAPR